MTVRDLGELRAETRAVVEEYLELTEAGLCRVARDTAADVLEDVRGHVLEELSGASSLADARTALEVFGEPDEFAAALCADIGGARDGVSPGSEAGARGGAGPDDAGGRRLLGIPYELRVPTTERVRSRWWNPADPAT